MTKKDFDKIASVIKSVLDEEDHPFVWSALILVAARLIPENDDQFDYAQFYRDCGIEG